MYFLFDVLIAGSQKTKDFTEMKRLKISGTGCSLMDFLYSGIDFESQAFRNYLSKRDGDGGLVPGHLVFLDELEKFAGKKFDGILRELTGGKVPAAFNLGGPAIVALINTAQLLHDRNVEVDFYAAAGKDEIGDNLFSILARTPVNTDNYIRVDGATPSTFVLSDPSFNGGKGERTFINDIGTAWNFSPADIKEEFFDSEVVLFGATALVPNIHDGLTGLLKKGKDKNCVNIVTTVFDFRNEKKHQGERWPLGESDESFKHIDLLIVDHVESLRISGERDIKKAIGFFIEKGVSSFIVTSGAENLTAYSDGRLFRKQELLSLPVSGSVVKTLEEHPELKGDTTGCGDNFAGGVIASLCRQLTERGKGSLDIAEACAWGIASGGFACFYMGGTYLEKTKGEKLEKVSALYQEYSKQIKDIYRLA